MATSVLSKLHDSIMSLKSNGTVSTHPFDDDSSERQHNNKGNHRHPNGAKQQQHPEKSQNDTDNSSNPASDDDDFRLSIPSFLTQHGQNLAQMDQTALAHCLQPVLSSLRKLDAESLLNLERVENGARLCDGVNVRPIHDEVYPRYDFGGTMSCVRYIHITEVPEQYSIGIFVFPPFARIPLHDHPEMCVLSRVLYGDLQCLSLDLLNDEEEARVAALQQQQQLQLQQQQAQQQQHNIHTVYQHHPYQTLQTQTAKDQFFHHQNAMQQLQHSPYAPHHAQHPHHHLPMGLPEGSRRVFKNPVKHLHAPDASMLFPYKGNLHEFFAGPNGAAVLDILLPPYDVEHERDCTFYDIREDPTLAALHAAASKQQQQSMMMDVDGPLDGAMAGDNGDNSSGGDDRTPCWIVPTCQPHDFHCLSGKYQKLGTNVITMQDAA